MSHLLQWSAVFVAITAALVAAFVLGLEALERAFTWWERRRDR